MKTAMHPGTTIDRQEVDHFDTIAEEWWDPDGAFKPLHLLNPVRLDYMREQIAAEFAVSLREASPFRGLSIVDIGCGGGLVTEPMARLGADVTGIDAAANSIPIAKAHAEAVGLSIAYEHATGEDLSERGLQFDIVLCLEVIEHVTDPRGLIATCYSLMRPGGLMICSTINRNPKSFALAIVGAEYLLRWLPRGSHDWKKFITPDELNAMIVESGLETLDRTGFVFNPVSDRWRLSAHDLSVNYAITCKRPA